ncbi:MAG: hypothetical protein AAGI07_16985 [Bacteroidota bacterium]
MKTTFMSMVILVITSTFCYAQFVKETSINAQIGYGLSAPYESFDNVVDSGFYFEGELVLEVLSWFEIRPYFGGVFTNSNGKDIDNNPTLEKAETKAILLGGKMRVRAPIPYIAPYIEVGVGTSIGRFTTFAGFDNIEKSGVIFHIPYSLGLELGKNNGVDLGLSYYFQPSVRQYAGAFAIGVTFPVNL